MIKQTKRKPSKGVIPNKGSIYNAVARERKKILNTLFELLDSRNPNVRLGAAKCLINKILPDLKSQEITGADGQPFTITVVTGDSLARTGFTPSPEGSSITGQPSVQSVSVAPESKKD